MTSLSVVAATLLSLCVGPLLRVSLLPEPTATEIEIPSTGVVMLDVAETADLQTSPSTALVPKGAEVTHVSVSVGAAGTAEVTPDGARAANLQNSSPASMVPWGALSTPTNIGVSAASAAKAAFKWSTPSPNRLTASWLGLCFIAAWLLLHFTLRWALPAGKASSSSDSSCRLASRDKDTCCPGPSISKPHIIVVDVEVNTAMDWELSELRSRVQTCQEREQALTSRLQGEHAAQVGLRGHWQEVYVALSVAREQVPQLGRMIRELEVGNWKHQRRAREFIAANAEIDAKLKEARRITEEWHRLPDKHRQLCAELQAGRTQVAEKRSQHQKLRSLNEDVANCRASIKAERQLSVKQRVRKRQMLSNHPWPPSPISETTSLEAPPPGIARCQEGKKSWLRPAAAEQPQGQVQGQKKAARVWAGASAKVARSRTPADQARRAG